MKIKLSDLWQWNGTIDRGPYVTLGVLLFAIKYNLDRFVASFIFHRWWFLFDYLQPASDPRFISLLREDILFYGILVLIALPFIWSGIVLTLRRLRAIRLPLWFVGIFFIPFVNLLFFLLLSLLPSREESRDSLPAERRLQKIMDRIIPDNPWGSAAMAILLTSLLGIGMAWFGTVMLRNYGWGLFVGLPFCLGLIAVLLHSYHRQRSFSECIAVSVCSVTLLAGFLLALAVEGVICLAMAAPPALGLAIFGGWIGYLIQRCFKRRHEIPPVILALMMAFPFLMGTEYVSSPEPPLFTVRTTIEIDAPVEKVWHHVVSFSELPPPHEWFFRAGIAYPTQAKIYGRGVGARRYCVFSTGSFIEPIEKWDEPRLLKFSVTVNPPPMEEWTPYSGIHPPHLNGFLVSRGGQFLLMPLAGDRTRLEGTTWYYHNMWPASYWQLWSDAIIHRIHRRVLNHVKFLSEQKT